MTKSKGHLSNSIGRFCQLNSKQRDYLLLTLILLFHFVGNLIWINQDGCNIVTVAEDMKINYLVEIYPEFVKVFQSENSPFMILRELGSILHNNEKFDLHGLDTPRLIYLISSVFLYLFGFSVHVAKLSNMLYFFILIFSVYFIGIKVKNRKAGLLSAFLVSMYPAIFGPSRGYGHDFPLTAMVSLAICFLIYSDYFSRRRPSLLFGLSLGLGILVKPQMVFFIIGPLSVVLFQILLKGINSVRKTESNDKLTIATFLSNGAKKDSLKPGFNNLINIFLALFIFLIISAFWWWGDVKEIYRSFLDDARLCWTGGQFTFNQLILMGVKWGPRDLFPSLLFYLKVIWQYTGLPFFLFFLGGLFFCFKRDLKGKMIILSWLFIPYIIFTLIATKYAKYLFPVFPAISLISIIGLWDLVFGKRLKTTQNTAKLNKLLIFILALGQYFWLSWFYNNNECPWDVRSPKSFHLTKNTIDKFKTNIESYSNENVRIGIVRKEGIWGINELIFLRYLLKMKVPHSFIRTSFFPWPMRFLDYQDTFDYLVVVNYPVPLKKKLTFLNKDFSDLSQYESYIPLSTIYMWYSAYQEEGIDSLKIDYNTPELWMNNQGLEEFINGLSKFSQPPPEVFRKLYEFVDISKEYTLICKGLFRYKNDILQAYLLKRK